MGSATDEPLDLQLTSVRPSAMAALCPVDRMPRRRRNQICIAIIAVGALNFLIYTVSYAALGGDAHNGRCQVVERADGTSEAAYFVRGHFIHSLNGQEAEVGRGVWIYSYVHSMSVLVTSAAMIISMLVLARPHILATMRDGRISGRLFVRAFGTLVVVIAAAALFVFAWDFVIQLRVG
jgi:hypothetical protein